MENIDLKIILISRKEQWRKSHQTIVQLGNDIAGNDDNCKDIRLRLYEWCDEAKSRQTECQSILEFLGE